MAILPYPCTSRPLTGAGFEAALTALGIDAPTLWTIMSVETPGCGYVADLRPQILFERHIFHQLTGGQFDATAPGISNPVAGGYGVGGVPNQYVRLGQAVDLNQEAALQSASWGLGQVMGSNYKIAGYGSVDEMITAMCASEDEQLMAMVGFISSKGLEDALRTQDWATYALHYNGSDYAKNQYDTRLAKAYTAYADGSPLPDLTVRAGQMCLLYLGFDPGGVDGLGGVHTITALHNFQVKHGQALTPVINAAVLATLEAALPAPLDLPAR